MRQFILFISVFIFTLCASSCKKTSVPDFHYDYFGQEEGRFVVYDVMEIIHDNSPIVIHDTTIYQLKTVWGELYIDNEGREARVYRRYTRNSPVDDWVLQDTWTGLINGIRAELIEENQRRIKLVFSPTIQKEWDGNAYNTDGELECYYTDIHQSLSLNGSMFDSTVTVEQADDANPLEMTRMYEVYAKGIGLVSKVDRYIYYNFQPTPQTGNELFYTYVSSGYQ